MIARKGAQRAPSFAHESHSTNPACATAGETALHKLAKDYLAEALLLTLPERTLTKGGITEIVVKESVIEFDSAELEKTMPGMKPDVIVYKRKKKLLVEMKVTHECDDRKIALIRDQELAAIEIDLGPFRDIPLDEIGPYILHKANRVWLNNPKDKDAEERIDRRLAQAEEAYQVEARRRLTAYRVVRQPREPLDKAAVESGLAEAVGVGSGGEGCFSVPSDVWQTSVLLDFVKVPGHYSLERTVKNLRLRKFLRAEFVDMPPRVREIMQSKVSLPESAIDRFMQQSARDGWVVQYGSGWSGTPKLISAVKKAEKLRERCARRRERLNGEIVALMATAPKSELVGFDIETWWQTPIASLGHPPGWYLLAEEEAWSGFLQLFSSMQWDLAHHPDAIVDALGLPILQERDRRIKRFALEAEERRVEQERKRVEAAESRIGETRAKAKHVLNVQADKWLQTRMDSLDGLSPLEASAYSPAAHSKVLASLDAENDRRRHRRFDEPTREKALDNLAEQARRRLGFEAGESWMQSRNEHLGNRAPRSYCIDQATLERCREALAQETS